MKGENKMEEKCDSCGLSKPKFECELCDIKVCKNCAEMVDYQCDNCEPPQLVPIQK